MSAQDLKHDSFAVGSGFLAFVVLGGSVSFFTTHNSLRTPAVQPIEFNHRLHVEDEGLECSMCHAFYERETYSGLPAAGACALCHLDPAGESAEEARLSQLLAEETPLVWQSLFRQPPHVFFSHRRHVAAAQLDCAACHGDIGLSEAPPGLRDPMTMDECLDCHEEESAATNCSACHR